MLSPNTVIAFSFAQRYLLPHSIFCFLSLDTMLTLGISHVSKNYYFILSYGVEAAFPVTWAGTITLCFPKLKT